MKDAPAKYLETVGRIHLLHLKGQVFLCLFEKPLADVAGGDKGSLLACEWRIIDGKEHAHGGFIHTDGRHALRIFKIGNGIANVEILGAEDGANLTGKHLVFDLFLAESFEEVQLLHD